jgi:glycosyltransferase involved in cell wall biosynthesis
MGNAAAQFARLYSRQHEVTVLTPDYRRLVPSAAQSYRIEWLRSPIRYGNAAGLPQLLWRLRHFDIIHLHYPFYGVHLPVLIACALPRPKLVLHYHMDSLATGVKGAIFEFNRRMVLPRLLARADVIVGASFDYLAHSQIASYFKTHREKFREVPFWVDSEKFSPEEIGNSADSVVLFVGGLDQAHYFKGLENLLRAMQTVVGKSADPVRLRVVGGGELLSYYQALAAELNIAERVGFLGKVDDDSLVRAYREASFLVLPSINQGEAFGLVLLEAMACGKPVIASNLPGVRSVFNDQENGFVVAVGDRADLAEKILRLAEDRPLRERMGQRARAMVLEKYREETAGQLLEGICRELAGSRLPEEGRERK